MSDHHTHRNPFERYYWHLDAYVAGIVDSDTLISSMPPSGRVSTTQRPYVPVRLPSDDYNGFPPVCKDAHTRSGAPRRIEHSLACLEHQRRAIFPLCLSGPAVSQNPRLGVYPLPSYSTRSVLDRAFDVQIAEPSEVASSTHRSLGTYRAPDSFDDFASELQGQQRYSYDWASRRASAPAQMIDTLFNHLDGSDFPRGLGYEEAPTTHFVDYTLEELHALTDPQTSPPQQPHNTPDASFPAPADELDLGATHTEDETEAVDVFDNDYEENAPAAGDHIGDAVSVADSDRSSSYYDSSDGGESDTNEDTAEATHTHFDNVEDDYSSVIESSPPPAPRAPTPEPISPGSYIPSAGSPQPPRHIVEAQWARWFHNHTTPTITLKRKRTEDEDAEDEFFDGSASPVRRPSHGDPATETPSTPICQVQVKRRRGQDAVMSAMGYVVLGAVLGSVGTIAGLASYAD